MKKILTILAVITSFASTAQHMPEYLQEIKDKHENALEALENRANTFISEDYQDFRTGEIADDTEDLLGYKQLHFLHSHIIELCDFSTTDDNLLDFINTLDLITSNIRSYIDEVFYPARHNGEYITFMIADKRHFQYLEENILHPNYKFWSWEDLDKLCDVYKTL